jgi:Domain of unknown function (DUF4190)
MTEPPYEPQPTPPQQPPYPYWGSAPPPPSPRNGLGIASLVIAIVALVLFWTVFGGVMLGIVAVLMGFAALGRVKHGQANNKGVAITGIVLGVVATVAGLLVAVPIVGYQNCIDHAQGRAEYARC